MTELRADPGRPLDGPGQGGAQVSHAAPLKEVLVELWQNSEKLLRQEVALASAELDMKADRLKAELTATAIGGAVLYAGLLALTAAAILLLAQVVAAWLSAVIVGVVAGAVGILMLRRHPRMDGEDVAPTRTAQSVQRDVHAFKEAMK